MDFINSGESSGSLRVAGGTPALPSELGLDFTGTVAGNNFSFLHNAYCVGQCTVSSWTSVVITLENTGLVPELLRFDSMITPGHLARQGSHFAYFASFNFDVTQTTDGVSNVLFHTTGLANHSGVNLNHQTVPAGFDFNGLERNSNGAEWEVLDWSATNLNLNLDVLMPGQTTTVRYFSLTQVNIPYTECATLIGCPGVQVAFGDPRNDGGVQALRTGLDLLGESGGDGSPLELDDPVVLAPVIGGKYAASSIYARVVDADTPLPETPPVLPRITYGAPFTPQATTVPEPATWAMMIAGFGLTGGAMRRRTRALASA